MWSFVDPVTNQVEVHICDFHQKHPLGDVIRTPKHQFCLFYLQNPVFEPQFYLFWKCYYREKRKCISGSQCFGYQTQRSSVDTDLIHTASGFPMLLRNAHSFAVGLCKCSEHNTRGLQSDSYYASSIGVLISGNEEGIKERDKWEQRRAVSELGSNYSNKY